MIGHRPPSAVCLIDGLPGHYYAPATVSLSEAARDARADAFFASTGARILNGGNCAYYRMASDHIQMPMFEAFFEAQGYYATLAHESIHWTRHPSRLDRSFDQQRFCAPFAPGWTWAAAVKATPMEPATAPGVITISEAWEASQ